MRKSVCIVLAALMLGGCSEGYTEEKRTEMAAEMSNAEGIADENYMNIDNRGSGWGLKKNKGAPPDIPDSVKETLKKNNGYFIDDRGEKVIYLTFDEGYENGYTAQILDVLKKTQVPAAFFITGAYFDREAELVKRMVDEGHIVGNHTENHPNLPKLESAEKMAAEMTVLNEKFLTQYGVPMKYMRPPEGEFSERLLKVASDLGYKTIFWSFAYKDWDPKMQRGADYAFNEVTSYMHDGAILLLHAVSKDNADALERIISDAREKGYEFKSLDELS